MRKSNQVEGVHCEILLDALIELRVRVHICISVNLRKIVTSTRLCGASTRVCARGAADVNIVARRAEDSCLNQPRLELVVEHYVEAINFVAPGAHVVHRSFTDERCNTVLRLLNAACDVRHLGWEPGARTWHVPPLSFVDPQLCWPPQPDIEPKKSDPSVREI